MDLRELIEAHRVGRSYPDLERDCGGSPTAKRLQQMVSSSIRNFPDPPTIAALARGLHVPQRVVVLAAAESLGLDVRQSVPRLTELLPVEAGALTEQQAAAIAHLVRTFVEPDPAAVEVEDADSKAERRAQTEATVPAVRAAKDEHVRHLRAVAAGGDASSDEVQAAIDELARLASVDQRGVES